MSLDLYIGICLALLGLVMGSAVTAIVHRLPNGISWARGRSACPHCGHVLGVADLVPLFSWVLTRGRCRYCGARVSVRYPLIEVTCALWAVLLYLKVGFTPAYIPLSLWGWMLVALMFIDLDHQLLPDALTFPGTLVAIAYALLVPGARHAILGMALGAGLLWGVGELWKRVRKIEAMGFGDVKLAAMFGAVLGWQLTFLTIFLAALMGSIWGAVLMWRGAGNSQTALPFGTLLCPAAMVAFLWGDGWIGAYLALIHR